MRYCCFAVMLLIVLPAAGQVESDLSQAALQNDFSRFDALSRRRPTPGLRSCTGSGRGPSRTRSAPSTERRRMTGWRACIRTTARSSSLSRSWMQRATPSIHQPRRGSFSPGERASRPQAASDSLGAQSLTAGRRAQRLRARRLLSSRRPCRPPLSCRNRRRL